MFISLDIGAQNDYLVTTKQEVVSHVIELTKEQKFIYDNFSSVNIADWHRGMRFIVYYEDYVFPKLKSMKGKGLYSYQKQIVEVDTVLEHSVSCPRGECIETHITFSMSNGDTLQYIYYGDKNKMRTTAIGGSVEGLVYLPDIDKAKSLLQNRTLYSMTRVGYVDTDKGSRVIAINKYAPYRVKSIGIGNSDYPVKIVAVSNDNKEVAFYVSMSGVNKSSYSVFGNGDFCNVFAFSNPKLVHKNISSNDWNLIMASKLRIGMNKTMCRLSWGYPEKINTTTGAFGVHEQWIYGKSYLYIENGKLTAVQN